MMNKEEGLKITHGISQLLAKRFFFYSDFEKSLLEWVDLNRIKVDYEILGVSVNRRSIYGLRLGSGEKRILVWSQMHGNESTMTRALFSALNRNQFVGVLKNISLYIIPVLNPDGLDQWTRNNANEVDLNRDAVDRSQPESRLLLEYIERVQPHFCFNLHDQRSIYGSLDGLTAMQLSFLAPAGDLPRTINDTRLASMLVINRIHSCLSKMYQSRTGRYNDSFNIDCFGDYLTSLNIPVVLFEAGHHSDDYNRNEVMGLMSDCLLHALESVANDFNLLDNDTLSRKRDSQNTITSNYESISEMSSCFVDLLLIKVPSKGDRVDVGVMFKEKIVEDVLCFFPVVCSINDPDVKNGHRVIDCSTMTTDDLDFEINQDGLIQSEVLNIDVFY